MNEMTQYDVEPSSLSGVENGAGTMQDDELSHVAMDNSSTYAGCPSCTTPYTVQRGDSFYIIARKFGIDVRELINANPNIAPGRLLVGDVLCVPSGSGSSGPACPVGSTPYVVQSGQTLTDVLVTNNVSVRALRQTNEGVRLTALAAGERSTTIWTTTNDPLKDETRPPNAPKRSAACIHMGSFLPQRGQ